MLHNSSELRNLPVCIHTCLHVFNIIYTHEQYVNKEQLYRDIIYRSISIDRSGTKQINLCTNEERYIDICICMCANYDYYRPLEPITES